MNPTKTYRVLAAACILVVPSIASAELFLDVGVQVSRIEARIANVAGTVDTTETGAHLGLGVFRRFGDQIGRAHV